MTEPPDLAEWIGRSELRHDLAARAPLTGLAALLDYDVPPWDESQVPPLGHWLYFQPLARQSELDVDGHPKRGGFIPPIPLERRMWAGGRMRFHAPLPVGAVLERRSTITDITAKSGASGELVFVTLKHELCANGARAVNEEQHLVYRAMPVGFGAAPPDDQPAPQAYSARSICLNAPALFRYSALTYNAHRIHYDHEYARNVEHYPGLVVQGPFIATLLIDHYLRLETGKRVRAFSFRAHRPLFANEAFDVCTGPPGPTTDLSARDAQGNLAMSAVVQVE